MQATPGIRGTTAQVVLAEAVALRVIAATPAMLERKAKAARAARVVRAVLDTVPTEAVAAQVCP